MVLPTRHRSVKRCCDDASLICDASVHSSAVHDYSGSAQRRLRRPPAPIGVGSTDPVDCSSGYSRQRPSSATSCTRESLRYRSSLKMSDAKPYASLLCRAASQSRLLFATAETSNSCLPEHAAHSARLTLELSFSVLSVPYAKQTVFHIGLRDMDGACRKARAMTSTYMASFYISSTPSDFACPSVHRLLELPQISLAATQQACAQTVDDRATQCE